MSLGVADTGVVLCCPGSWTGSICHWRSDCFKAHMRYWNFFSFSKDVHESVHSSICLSVCVYTRAWRPEVDIKAFHSHSPPLSSLDLVSPSG